MSGMLSVGASYAWCDHLSRRAAKNFYHAFRLLPHARRRAMSALYAYMRICDDLADGAEPVEYKRVLLADWRESLHAALEGEYRHPIFPALRHTIRTYRLPVRYLEDVLDGVCQDLEVSRYPTRPDLDRYCYLVAGAVGISCIHVWGFTGDALPAAEAAGRALQLTNILRDVAEDAANGRIYLPLEDLARFGVDESQVLTGRMDPAFRELLRFEAARAYADYDAARELLPRLNPAGRAVFLVILRTYRALLDAIAARDYDVLTERVRVGTAHKLWLALQAVPVRLGLWSGH